MIWGIIPAAGSGTRIQPLAFSKELLPVGSRVDERGAERPRAVSEYLVERMVAAGARAPRLRDLTVEERHRLLLRRRRMARRASPMPCRTRRGGLCDAIFAALPIIPEDAPVLVGLPDTIWFPTDGLRRLPQSRLSFLLFPVEQPQFFDAVDTDAQGRVREVQVKRAEPSTHWVWGAFRLPPGCLHRLHALWRARGCADEYFGTLVNAWIAAGGEAYGLRAGESYVDVGTLHGYREAMALLGGRAAPATSVFAGRRGAA